MRDAQLAGRLTEHESRADVLVLGLPRGGVPVALEIASRLDVPLDAFLVRKVGVPGHSELAMGAVATGGVEAWNTDIINDLDVPADLVRRLAAREQAEVGRRDAVLRGSRPPPAVKGKTVIVVDDGVATGVTMEAAIAALRQREPATIVVAAPVGAPETCDRIRALSDRFVCLMMPIGFHAVGSWYDDFTEITDEDVRRMLASAVGAGNARTSG